MSSTRSTAAMASLPQISVCSGLATGASARTVGERRSEEHTSELQSLTNLVCRLLLEKKKQLHRANSTMRRFDHSPIGIVHPGEQCFPETAHFRTRDRIQYLTPTLGVLPAGLDVDASG